jgi:hypothetical protein
MRSSTRVFGVEVRESEEVLRGGSNHTSCNTRTELKDLAADVSKEGIR